MDGAVEALRRHLTRQLEDMERVGSLYRSGGFANQVRGIVNPSNLRNRSLKAPLKRASMPTIRFHDLRHYAPRACSPEMSTPRSSQS